MIPKKTNKKNSDEGGEGQASGIALFDDQNSILKIAPEKIKINSMQPRRNFDQVKISDLANSIKEHGIIQPLVVAKSGDNFELIAGERRLRAAKEIGLKEVPVIIRKADEQEKLEVALIENLQRENLNPIETAAAYRKLIDEFNLNQDEVAKKVGKSRPVIANTLRFLNLPEEIQRALIDDRLSEGHAKYLLGIDNPVKQMNFFRKIVNNKMTVAETDFELKKTGGTKNARVKINYEDKDKEFVFREFFGAKIEIKRKGRGGQIIINFFSDDELDEIVKKVK